MPCSETQDERDWWAQSRGYRDECHQRQHERTALEVACESVALLRNAGLIGSLSETAIEWVLDHDARDRRRAVWRERQQTAALRRHGVNSDVVG